jgi:hypothetical protein
MIRPRLLALALLAAPCLAQSAAPAVKQTVTAAMGTTAPTVKVAEKPIVPFTVWQLRPGDSTESQVTPVQLNPSGYWLMLYIDSSSKASLDLLSQVQTLAQTQAVEPSGALIQPKPAANGAPSYSQYKIDASKLVIIVAHASGAQLSQFQLNYPGLAAAAWTHDSKSAAAHLLGIHGTPHLFGMREGQQRWQLAETLKPADLEPVLTTWTGFNRLPANKLTRRKPTPPANLAAAKTAPTTPTPPQGPSK